MQAPADHALMGSRERRGDARQRKPGPKTLATAATGAASKERPKIGAEPETGGISRGPTVTQRAIAAAEAEAAEAAEAEKTL